ncbi:MAG: hypothetical protein ACFFAN_15900 [Promethearchaeota archaeon]
MKKFIDFDKKKTILYDNIWLDEKNFVIKIPLLEKKTLENDLKIEKFNLANHVYLLGYD